MRRNYHSEVAKGAGSVIVIVAGIAMFVTYAFNTDVLSSVKNAKSSATGAMQNSGNTLLVKIPPSIQWLDGAQFVYTNADGVQIEYTIKGLYLEKQP